MTRSPSCVADWPAQIVFPKGEAFQRGQPARFPRSSPLNPLLGRSIRVTKPSSSVRTPFQRWMGTLSSIQFWLFAHPPPLWLRRTLQARRGPVTGMGPTQRTPVSGPFCRWPAGVPGAAVSLSRAWGLRALGGYISGAIAASGEMGKRVTGVYRSGIGPVFLMELLGSSAKSRHRDFCRRAIRGSCPKYSLFGPGGYRGGGCYRKQVCFPHGAWMQE